MMTLPQLTLMSFDTGNVILQKDCSVHHWHHVMVGYVAAAVPIDNGKRLPVHIYAQNEWFGEQALLTKQPSHFEYACLTPVELISMPKKCFDIAMSEESNFVHLLAELVALRAQQHGSMLTLMHLGSSPLQVIMGLAQFAESDQRKMKDPNKTWLPSSVDVPVSQTQIADYCGVSRTLFSEYIQHLAAAGWLKLRYGGIELQSVETWRLFARSQRQRQSVPSRPTIRELMDEMATAHAELGPYRFPNLIAKRAVKKVALPMGKKSDAIGCVG